MIEFRCYYEDGFSEPCSFWDAHMWPIFDTVDQSGIATYVKDSIAIVPWAGAVHLLMLAAIGGLILMVDLRALGFGLKSYRTAELERRLRTPLIAAIVVMVLSGITLGLGQVMRLFESVPYHMKMIALFSALLFSFAARPQIYAGNGGVGLVRRILAIIAIALWVYTFVLLASPLAWGAMAVLAAVLFLLSWIGNARRAQGESVPFGARATAMTSIALWLTVAVSGRWIAFY